MFKKPIIVNVEHDLNVDALKETYETAKGDMKQMLKTAGIALAIGIPCAILFGVAANVAGDVITDRLITQ